MYRDTYGIATLVVVHNPTLQPLTAGNSAEFSQADNSKTIQHRANVGFLRFLGIDSCMFQNHKSEKNMNEITLKTTGTQSLIYFVSHQ